MTTPASSLPADARPVRSLRYQRARAAGTCQRCGDRPARTMGMRPKTGPLAYTRVFLCEQCADCARLRGHPVIALAEAS